MKAKRREFRFSDEADAELERLMRAHDRNATEIVEGLILAQPSVEVAPPEVSPAAPGKIVSPVLSDLQKPGRKRMSSYRPDTKKVMAAQKWLKTGKRDD